MKNIYIVIFLILSINSFSQFFDNELDYLVYDKQDSLIKELGVKSLSITKHNAVKEELLVKSLKNYTVDGDIKSDVTQRFDWWMCNKKYIRKSSLRKGENSCKYSIFYEYDEFKRLIEERYESFKPKLNEGQVAKGIGTFKKGKLKKGKLRKVKLGDKLKEFDFIEYRYGVANKIELIKKCNKKTCEYTKYYYASDTLRMVTESSKGKKQAEKTVVEKELSKNIIKVDYLHNSKSLEKTYYKNDSIIISRKSYGPNTGGNLTQYFLNDENKIIKKSRILRDNLRSESQLNKDNTITIYAYDVTGRLIEVKELRDNISNLSKIIRYYPNGLIKEILEDWYSKTKSVYNYEFYNK